MYTREDLRGAYYTTSRFCSTMVQRWPYTWEGGLGGRREEHTRERPVTGAVGRRAAAVVAQPAEGTEAAVAVAMEADEEARRAGASV